MAKELGQIHTCNETMTAQNPGDVHDIDLPGLLSSQLQRMVRQGNFFKCVGIDIGLTATGAVGGGQVSGWLRYYAPTKGRCDAYRAAFKAMKQQLKMQGLTTSTNPLYDFRCSFNDQSPAGFPNQATLDGTNGLVLNSLSSLHHSVFGTHNYGVTPTYEGSTAGLFGEGFDTLLQNTSGRTDFVLNDAVPWTGNSDEASLEWEYIPFTLSWTPDSTDQAVSFQWRPDPALYLAIMCGLIQVHVEEIDLDSGAPSLELNIAVMVSGWKSIMSDRRHSRKKSSKKKSKK